MRLKTLIISYSIVLLAYEASVGAITPPKEIIEVLTEFTMLIASLVIMFYIDRLKESRSVFWIMNIGASLLYLGLFFDFFEEFFIQPNILDNSYEDIIQTAGFLIICLGIQRWISLHCNLVAQLHKTASTDHMTGLLNRRAFYQHVESDSPLTPIHSSFLLIDIDHFKSINDQYGHAFGDIVISKVATIIRSNIGDNQLAVRWGGEEFLIYFKQCDGSQASIIAESLRSTIEKATFTDHTNSVSCTVSIGLYTTQEQVSYDHGIDRADIALYQAKHNGRNNVTVFKTDEVLDPH
ncbi:GGDEF domain-containing protein [Psychrobium sp. 1_MG-2023]|uniref:GGDEF domain-containing protein n=1 Tax=Psychrobium sp. 1_MG-2023 TaxID=3062624 RepID=UPI0027360A2A|nr:GGDEF domain-containing protein [Psychrobium sp. 1_MG-2023]MDP2560773.1 GGDEF domain-containing protein [Psychrobium sp. 1_MG-2023]